MKKLLLPALLVLSAGAVRAEDAAPVWTKQCKSCHGVDGKGDTEMGRKSKAEDLSDAAWQGRHSDAKIRDAIENGVPKTKMKGYKEKLSPEQIDALVAYVRSLKAK
jgi:mono/diheme cytochrome c family protein